MDDDLGEFGPSVWSTSDVPSTSKLQQADPHNVFTSSPPVELSFSQMDKFDDFSGDFQTSNDQGGFNDDFGDFEEFSDSAQTGGNVSFASEPLEDGDLGFGGTTSLLGQWKSLVLEPFPSTAKLKQDIEGLLDPLVDPEDSHFFTEEDIRQVEGLNQILVTQERLAVRVVTLIPSLLTRDASAGPSSTHYSKFHQTSDHLTGYGLAFVDNI